MGPIIARENISSKELDVGVGIKAVRNGIERD